MGYLSKALLKKAYLTLSNLTEDHKQGQTQIVSALRYIVALDMFYKSKGRSCNLNNSIDRDDFTSNVRFVVNINEDNYTANFHTTIESLEDCRVGSNFYSAGVVAKSKVNPSTTFDYPTRGSFPLFQVKNNALYIEKSYYENIQNYLPNDILKSAFTIWLLRNEYLEELSYGEIKKNILAIVSEELADELMPGQHTFDKYIDNYDLEETQPQISPADFLRILDHAVGEKKIKASQDGIIDQTHLFHKKKYTPYLTALRTKPFMLLAGISGTGKSRIVREMAFKTCPKYLQDKDGTTPGNYCMIEVKPNWHDSTELIGYYSNLSQSYQFKKFVKFLVKAKMNPEVPFFVCLDEMNLAPVEQYFAEILSILETRKHPKKDGIPDMSTIKTGVIVDSVYFDKITWKDEQGATHEKLITSDSDWYKAFFSVEKGSEEEAQVMKYQTSYTLREEGLKLPDNVFIIGTVNMDDTAHQFSRKVIDRAMTIEMNGGRLSDMYGGSSDLEYIEDEEVQRSWQQAFRQYYVTADEVLEEHPESAETLKKELPARLEEINKALKGTPFEVSYRVLNELTIMVGVMLDDKKEGEELEDIINRTVDNILLMKILPRIEGDADMFTITKTNEIPYNNRLEWLMAIAPDIKGNKTTEEEEGAISPEESSRSTAKDKIKEMIDRLNNQEFTRFWP